MHNRWACTWQKHTECICVFDLNCDLWQNQNSKRNTVFPFVSSRVLYLFRDNECANFAAMRKKKWLKNRFLSFISLFATIVNAFAHNERFLLMSNLQGKLSSIENQWPFRNEIEFPGLMLGSVHFRLNALSCSHLNCAYTQTNRFQSRFQMLVFTSHSVWKIRIRIRHRKLYWISLKSSTMRHSCVCVRESEAQSSTKLQSAKISKSFNHEIAQRSRRRRTQCHRHNARTATMHILHVYPRCRYMNMAFIVTSTLKCARYESMIYLNTSLNQWIDCSNATYYY